MKSYPLLTKAPKDHNSQEFLDFLRANNTVVCENKHWLIIENCKYHTPEAKHHTAFIKSNQGWFLMNDEHYKSLLSLIIAMGYTTWTLVIKKPADRSVGRLHVHFIEK